MFIQQVKDVAELANVYFLRQKVTKGLGHAILCGKSFVGNEPFAVLYGDDVIIGKDPVTAQLCRAYEAYGKGVVGVQEVTREQIKKYCTLDVTPLVRFSRKRGLKFNMLLCWCIGKAAGGIKEFYTLPVGRELLHYDRDSF